MEIIYFIMAITHIIFPTISYILWVKNVFGKYPDSYSGTYRMWEERFNKGYIFTSWTGIASVLLIPSLAHFSLNIYELVVAMICPIMLVLVGLYPTSIDRYTTKLHCIFAKLCAGFAILWLFMKGIYIPTLILCIGGFIWSRLWQRKYETLIMELMAFLSANIGIIICYLR